MDFDFQGLFWKWEVQFLPNQWESYYIYDLFNGIAGKRQLYRLWVDQLFVVAFLSRLDGASVASTCHQSVWLERFLQKSLKNWQKSPTIPHSSNLWGIFPKFAFYCIFINKYQNPHNRENSPFLVTLNARNFCWAAEGLSDWLVWLVDNKNIVGCWQRRSPPEIYI